MDERKKTRESETAKIDTKTKIDQLIPPEKRKLTHTIIHEAGHAALALRNGIGVLGYWIGDVVVGDLKDYKEEVNEGDDGVLPDVMVEQRASFG